MTREERLREMIDRWTAEDAEKDREIAALKAERDELLGHLDRMLLVGCWFHEGPYNESPDVEDYRRAKAAYINMKEAGRGRQQS